MKDSSAMRHVPKYSSKIKINIFLSFSLRMNLFSFIS